MGRKPFYLYSFIFFGLEEMTGGVYMISSRAGNETCIKVTTQLEHDREEKDGLEGTYCEAKFRRLFVRLDGYGEGISSCFERHRHHQPVSVTAERKHMCKPRPRSRKRPREHGLVTRLMSLDHFLSPLPSMLLLLLLLLTVCFGSRKCQQSPRGGAALPLGPI